MRRGAVGMGAVLEDRRGRQVWTVLYRSGTSTCYADCRPGFRARYTAPQPWALTSIEEGEAIVHGYCDEHGSAVQLPEFNG